MAKKASKQGLTALPLGGLDEIGLNLMVYECDGDMILVDVGLTFPDEYAPGTDIVVPDVSYIRENVDRLKGIFITHAHEDHIGALPYLWEELGKAPVYATQFTECVLSGKMAQFDLLPPEYNIHVTKEGERYKAGCFEVEYISITHSVPGSAALVIRTPYGNIVNTGDYKLDRNPVLGGPSNLERIKQIGEEGVLALFSDSTDIFGEGEKPSETELSESLDDIIAGQNKAIFVSPFASNFERILSVSEIAVKHGRKICYAGRSIQNMVQYAKECNMFPDYLLDHIVDMSNASRIAREDILYFVTGSQAQPNAMLNRLSAGENYRGIQIASGDTVILSSRHIPGNERAIQNMMNRLTKAGARVLSGHNAFVHVGGHGHKDETKQIYQLLKPQYSVPSYGTYTHLKEHQKFVEDNKLAKCLFITNGDKLHLAPEEPSIIERVETGRCYVDGYNILDEDKFILRERRQMSFDGLATVTLGIDFRNKSIAFGPIVKTKGIIDEDLQDDVLETVVAEVERSLSGKYKDGRIDDPLEAEEVMRQAVRRAFGRERGRKPVTVPLVVEIQ